MTPFSAKISSALVAAATVSLAGCGSSEAAQPGGGVPANQPGLELQLLDGRVLGQEVGATRAFRGLPFAAPPTGPRRWRAPEPAEPWDGVRDATAYGAECPQLDSLTSLPSITDAEDCLFLNVWTPSAPPAAPLPVMVWLTGGAFTIGSGKGLLGEETYPGDSLVPSAGVVLVTVNYRLGALGFLAHESLDAEQPGVPSGNYGLLDQRAALRWVQANIAAFGGDPDRVTLFGESAGGISVMAHLTSPGSRGLFHRAIVESGPSDMLISTRSDALAAGLRLSTALGCPGDGVLACLRAADQDELLRALPARVIFGDGVRWGPNVDGQVLTDLPLAALPAQVDPGIPVLLGSNRDEGTFFTRGQAGITADEYPALLAAVAETARADEAGLLAAYPAADFDTPGAALAQAVGDGGFTCPTRRQARALAAAGNPVFLYQFTRPVETVLFRGLGAFHGAELPFVFQGEFNGLVLDAEELALSAAMQGYWGQLAAEGTPGGSAPPWPPYDAVQDRHQILDLTVTSGEGLLAERCDVWDGLTR